MTEEYEKAYPMLMISVEPSKLGKTAADIVSELKENKVFARDNHIDCGIFYIHSLNLDKKTTHILREKLYDILKKGD